MLFLLNNMNAIRAIQIILILFCFNILSCKSSSNNNIVPKVKKGVINVKNYDFPQKGSILLDGTWEFYWNKLLKASDFNSIKQKTKEYIGVPGQWTKKKIQGEKLPGTGFATYRVTIKTEPNKTLMALKLFHVLSAFKVWVNGELVAAYGDVSKSQQSKKQYVFPVYRIAKFMLHKKNNEVIVQVLNYHNKSGGFFHSIELGTEEDLHKRYTNYIFFAILIAGCIFFIGLYNLFQYLFRKNDRTPLIFFFLTLNWFVNTIVLHTPIMENYGFSHKFIYIIDYITMTMNLPLIMMLMKRFFPDDCHNITVTMSQATSAVVLISLFFTDYLQSKLVMQGYFAINILIIFYAVYLLARVLYYKRKDAYILFTGILLHMISGFNDMLYEAKIIDSILISHYGLFFLCISMSAVISLRFSRAFSQVEQLSIELTRMDKLKDEFLAKTSHELKTPLHGIIGISESILESSVHLSDKVKEDISLISKSGQRLSTLVNDILDYSKMKHEVIDLNFKPIDLFSTTGLVIKLSEVLIGDKNLAIKNLVPQDIPAAMGDEDRIKQILYNLIGNAIKFTSKGVIEISAALITVDSNNKNLSTNTNQMIEMRVRDTGIGIPEQYLGSIFDSFQQVDATDSRIYEGTGLGLAITKKLVEQHNGNIRVISESNKGSVFIFTLPVFIESHPAKIDRKLLKPDLLINNLEPAQYKPTEIDFDNNPVILIVDDDPVNIRILKNYLDRKNCQLLTAMNGLEALDFITSETPIDLILLDVMMPVLTGYDVCRRIRELFTTEELPVIMLTAKSQLSDINTGFEAGANDYIVKPFQIRELLHRINTVLKLKNINRAIHTGIKLSDRGNSYFFIFNEIIYITIKSRGLIFHTTDHDIEISGFYKDLKESLPADIFIRIHKQYVINMSHVLTISHVISGRYKILLKDNDDTELPVGRSFLEHVREKL